MTDPDDETRDLPVILWTEDFEWAEPPGYRPEFHDMGDGVVLDEHRLPWLLDWLLTMHPESDRLRALAREHPGLEVKDEPDGWMILARLSYSGEPVGRFDRRLLLA